MGTEVAAATAAMAVLLMDMNLIAEEEDLNINSWTVRHWHFTSLHLLTYSCIQLNLSGDICMPGMKENHLICQEVVLLWLYIFFHIH